MERLADKIPVTFIQRKAREVGNYSVEFIFKDVRKRLTNDIEARIVESKYESRGFFKRLYNCIEAFRNQGLVTHVTGDINYVGLFLNKRTTIHTILDCVFLNSTTGIKHSILKLFWLTIPVRRSTYITAISEATKNEILKYSNCDAEKIVVIPVAISERFSRKHKKFNAEQPVILQIGTAHNKNIPRLIEALRGINCKLVIVGRHNHEYEKLLIDSKLEYEYKSGLSDEEMLLAYEQADIISFASTYEGFGMPILEAQAIGRPVVTSELSSMPEVAGNAACLVDPFDIESIRNGFIKVITNIEYRDALLEAGFENIKRFSPHRIAQQYLNLYKKIHQAEPDRKHAQSFG